MCYLQYLIAIQLQLQLVQLELGNESSTHFDYSKSKQYHHFITYTAFTKAMDIDAFFPFKRL